MHMTFKHNIVDCVAFSYMYISCLVDLIVHTFDSKCFIKTSLLVRESNFYWISTELNFNVLSLLNYSSMGISLQIIGNHQQAAWYNDLRDHKVNLKPHIHCVQKRMVGFGTLCLEIHKMYHIHCGTFRLSYSTTFKDSCQISAPPNLAVYGCSM